MNGNRDPDPDSGGRGRGRGRPAAAVGTEPRVKRLKQQLCWGKQNSGAGATPRGWMEAGEGGRDGT